MQKKASPRLADLPGRPCPGPRPHSPEGKSGGTGPPRPLHPLRHAQLRGAHGSCGLGKYGLLGITLLIANFRGHWTLDNSCWPTFSSRELYIQYIPPASADSGASCHCHWNLLQCVGAWRGHWTLDRQLEAWGPGKLTSTDTEAAPGWSGHPTQRLQRCLAHCAYQTAIGRQDS